MSVILPGLGCVALTMPADAAVQLEGRLVQAATRVRRTATAPTR